MTTPSVGEGGEEPGPSQPAGGTALGRGSVASEKLNALLTYKPEVPLLVICSREMESDVSDNRQDTDTA